MNVAHVHGKRFPVVWVDRSEDERQEPLFVIVQDNAIGIVGLSLVKDWADQALQCVESKIEDATLENLNGAYSWIGIQRPDTGEVLPVTVELRFYREMFVRYQLDGDAVCDTYKV